MNTRQAFLNALSASEDDTTTRLVYADWLDERGEHEEADRQRRWPAAKDWLVRFCRELADPDVEFDDEEPDEGNPYSFFNLSYENMLKLGQRAVDEGGGTGIQLYCGANGTMMDALETNRREFWKNWSVVTGIPLPPEVEETSRFTCSC